MSNPTSRETLAALEDAKARREQAEAVKEKSILRMLGNGVPHREIAKELGVSRGLVEKVHARSRSWARRR